MPLRCYAIERERSMIRIWINDSMFNTNVYIRAPTNGAQHELALAPIMVRNICTYVWYVTHRFICTMAVSNIRTSTHIHTFMGTSSYRHICHMFSCSYSMNFFPKRLFGSTKLDVCEKAHTSTHSHAHHNLIQVRLRGTEIESQHLNSIFKLAFWQHFDDNFQNRHKNQFFLQISTASKFIYSYRSN